MDCVIAPWLWHTHVYTKLDDWNWRRIEMQSSHLWTEAILHPVYCNASAFSWLFNARLDDPWAIWLINWSLSIRQKFILWSSRFMGAQRTHWSHCCHRSSCDSIRTTIDSRSTSKHLNGSLATDRACKQSDVIHNHRTELSRGRIRKLFWYYPWVAPVLFPRCSQSQVSNFVCVPDFTAVVLLQRLTRKSSLLYIHLWSSAGDSNKGQ